MKISIRFIALLMLLSITPSFADTPSEWYDCDQNDECIITRDYCGTPTAVNKSYLTAADAYRKEMAPRFNCSTSLQKDITTYKAICQHRKESCLKKNNDGVVVGIDQESTCMSTHKKCTATE